MIKENKVYVIEQGNYSDFDWYGVFSTIKEAKEHVLYIVNNISFYRVEDENDNEITFKSYEEYKETTKKDWSSFDIVELDLNSFKGDIFLLTYDKKAKKKYREWKLNRIKEREQKWTKNNK